MNIYKIDYKYVPGDIEASVVMAINKDEAREFATKECLGGNVEIASIEEVCKTKKGIIYTGYNTR